MTVITRRFLYLAIATFLFGSTASAGAPLPGGATDTITTIIISGNRVTKNETVKYLSGLSVGMRYDSLKINRARKSLQNTNLFYKVDIISLRNRDGYRVYIILTEKFYLLPGDVGGELYSYRYGKRHDWWRLRVGTEYSNFRGQAEMLRLNFSIWDWHSMGIGWSKPLLPSPYFISLGISADQYPDEVFPIDHSSLRSTLSVGRKLPLNSRVDLSASPMYRRRIERNEDLSIADTMRVYEAFSLLRWRTDFRNRSFDPTDGWMIAMDLRTNALYNGIAPQFLQLTQDFRWYSVGVLPSHRLACRLTSALRNTDAGATHRLQLGGEGSVRGFPRSQFGRYFVANNSMTLAMEYRLPLFTFPDMDLFLLNQFSPVFSAISYRLDAAIILDYGRLAHSPKNLFTPNADSVESGTGIGGGLRVVTPTFERSVCFDLVWGTDPRYPRGFMVLRREPMWHFYLDMYF